MLTLNEAISTLWTARLNIEVILLADADGDAYFNMRARPWKNGAHDGYMLLVGGYVLEDVFVLVADAFMREDWKRLDWTRRTLPGASPETAPIQFPTQKAPKAHESHSEPSGPHIEYPYTNR